MKNQQYKNIICFGEVLWDMLPSGAKPGGAPLNVAIHLNKQGLNPLLISKIGNDKEGEELNTFLHDSGINTDLIQIDKQLPTSQVLVHLDKNKNATYEICEPVAWDNIEVTPEIDNALKSVDLIIYGSLASRNKTTRETLLYLLKNSNATRLVDINLRSPYDKREWIEELLQISDFAKLNNDELKRIAEWNGINGDEPELTKWLAGFYQCETVCVTRGENGAIIYSDGELFEHPGFKVLVADTVGAGDSFLASLVSSLSENKSTQQALAKACATGAFVASQNGAVPHYSGNEIEKIIHK